MKGHEMKIERDEDGWINIKRIGGVKFVPVTALELQGNEDAEELAGYGYIKFSGLDGEAMGRAFGGLYASIADWIEDVLTEQIGQGDFTEKEDAMNTNFSKDNKCAHPPCSCTVAPGEKYCSTECAAMEKTPDISCECHHAGCKGNIGT